MSKLFFERIPVSALLLGLFAGACGGPQAPVAEVVEAELQPHAVILAHLERTTDLFTLPDESVATLRERAGDTPRRERGPIERKLAIANLYAAEDALANDAIDEAEDAFRMVARHARAAERALDGDDVEIEMDFVRLWAEWRAGNLDAAELAEDFAEDHEEARDWVRIAWVLRGELEAANGNWDDAATGYRFLMAELEHPLYPFVLLRTAHMMEERGREEEARDLRQQVIRQGCRAELHQEVAMVVEAAASEARVPLTEDADGNLRPADCDAAATTETRDIDNELPPALQN